MKNKKKVAEADVSLKWAKRVENRVFLSFHKFLSLVLAGINLK